MKKIMLIILLIPAISYSEGLEHTLPPKEIWPGFLRKTAHFRLEIANLTMRTLEISYTAHTFDIGKNGGVIKQGIADFVKLPRPFILHPDQQRFPTIKAQPPKGVYTMPVLLLTTATVMGKDAGVRIRLQFLDYFLLQHRKPKRRLCIDSLTTGSDGTFTLTLTNTGKFGLVTGRDGYIETRNGRVNLPSGKILLGGRTREFILKGNVSEGEVKCIVDIVNSRRLFGRRWSSLQ